MCFIAFDNYIVFFNEFQFLQKKNDDTADESSISESSDEGTDETQESSKNESSDEGSDDSQKTDESETGGDESSVADPSDEDPNGLSGENVSNVNLRDDTVTEMKHKNAYAISLDNYELKDVTSSVRGTINSVSWLGDRMILDIYPDDASDCIETGIFDPYANTYEKIGREEFSAAYGSYSCVVQDRYYAMVTTAENGSAFRGKLLIYDGKTNKLNTADEYGTYNIVQYITPVGENGLAYFYYEDGSQDWVIKYYDLEKNTSKEVFRKSNSDNGQASPVAIACDGKDIALVSQFDENGTEHTLISRITTDGKPGKTEDIDLYRFFGDEDYRISDVIIEGDYYYIKAVTGKDETEKEEFYIFRRENDKFTFVYPAVFTTNDTVSDDLSDEGSLFFRNKDGIMGEIFRLDMTGNSISTYQLSGGSATEDTIGFIKGGSKGDMVIIYNTDPAHCKYYLVKDYKSIDEPVHDSALYVSPQDQLEELKASGTATPEEIEQKEKEIEEMIKWEKDFRMKFVYSTYD